MYLKSRESRNDQSNRRDIKSCTPEASSTIRELAERSLIGTYLYS